MRRVSRATRINDTDPARSLFAGFIFMTLFFVGVILMLAGPSATVAHAQTLPREALQTLLTGNGRYVGNTAIRPNPAHRPSDAKQHPIATVLSCSDSRVPPEILFDQGVGGIFVVREAGNTYNALGFESIEYAVTQLKTPLIVVLGHDSCGAVTAAVDSYPKPNVGPLRKNIYPAVRKALKLPHNDQEELISNAVDQNAILMARSLAEKQALKKLIKTGDLEIVAARYNLTTGAVKILEREANS
ncbi:MAG: carbonic anhydrase, partial [Candidatus Binataceae bacterium]